MTAARKAPPITRSHDANFLAQVSRRAGDMNRAGQLFALASRLQEVERIRLQLDAAQRRVEEARCAVGQA